MNKTLKIILLSGILMLSACSKNTTSTSIETVNKIEVLEKAVKNLSEQKSAHIKMKTNINVVDEGNINNISTNMDMKVIINPVQAEAEVSFDAGSNKSMNLKMYVKDKEAYVNIGTPNIWIKSNTDTFDIEKYIDQSKNTESTDFLKKFENEITLTEDGNNYEIKFDKSNMAFSEILSLFKSSGAFGESIPTDKQLQQTKVDKVLISYILDKNTFTVSKVMIEISISQKDNDKNTISVKTEIEYSDVNAINEIVIPQEVKDEAISE